MVLIYKNDAKIIMKISNKRTGKYFQIFGFCLIFVAAFVTAQAQAGKLTVISDGRDQSESAPETPAEYQLIKKEVKKNEALIKEKSELDCNDEADDSFGIVGAANGSFTRPNVSQKAYLYELCRSGRSFGIGGIVIVEAGRVVAHYTYGENGLNSDIAALPDINQNGLSEILLIGGGTGQGYTMGAVEIVEIVPGGIKSFGIADTYEDNFGTENAKKSAKAFKVSVQAGKTPVYFRETYTRKSEEGKWILAGKSQKYSLRKDYEPKYHKIS
jgi:hypothetical protein